MKHMKFFTTDERHINFAGDIQGIIEREAINHNMLARNVSGIVAKIHSKEAIVAFNDKRIIGYVELDFWDNSANFDSRLLLEIGGLVVSPEHRNCGIGTKLAKKAIKLAKKRSSGQHIIALCNNNSRGIFKKHGFVPVPKCCLPDQLWDICPNCDDFSSFPACRCEALLQSDGRVDVTFDALTVDSPHIEEMASLYCQVWREPPWREDFWKPNEVIADIKNELSKPNAMGYVAIASQLCSELSGWAVGPAVAKKVVGFTWGYQVQKDEIAEIAGHRQLDYLFDGSPVFYIDELATDIEHRQRGLAIKASWLLLRFAESRGIELVLLRTDMKAKAARSLYKKLGFKELAIVDAAHIDRTYWLLNLVPKTMRRV